MHIYSTRIPALFFLDFLGLFPPFKAYMLLLFPVLTSASSSLLGGTFLNLTICDPNNTLGEKLLGYCAGAGEREEGLGDEERGDASPILNDELFDLLFMSTIDRKMSSVLGGVPEGLGEDVPLSSPYNPLPHLLYAS